MPNVRDAAKTMLLGKRNTLNARKKGLKMNDFSTNLKEQKNYQQESKLNSKRIEGNNEGAADFRTIERKYYEQVQA